MRVLVIDDDRDCRESLVDLLQAEGHEVGGAADGEAGLEAAVDRRPDVIFVDAVMPRMSGLQLLRELHRRPDVSAIPVVLVTGLAPERIGEVDAHVLTKPFTVEDLLDVLQRAAGTSRAA